MASKTGDKVEAEAPKKTTVDTNATAEKPAKEKKEPKAPTTRRYRLLDGVDVKSFKGQRAVVANALQELSAQGVGDGTFTVEQIVAQCGDKLVSKTPLEASAKFHLNGMIKDKQVTVVDVPVTVTA